MRVAHTAGCCGAADKASCTRPPCPCNLEEYSKRELRELENARRERLRRADADRTPPKYEAGL